MPVEFEGKSVELSVESWGIWRNVPRFSVIDRDEETKNPEVSVGKRLRGDNDLREVFCDARSIVVVGARLRDDVFEGDGNAVRRFLRSAH